MRWNLRFEIAETVPVEALVQINLGDGDGAPVLGLRKRFAIMAVNSRDHPVTGGIGVCAANDINVILAGACRAKDWVAAPHGPRDNLRTVVAEVARDFREKTVVAHHHTHLTEAGLEDGILCAR